MSRCSASARTYLRLIASSFSAVRKNVVSTPRSRAGYSDRRRRAVGRNETAHPVTTLMEEVTYAHRYAAFASRAFDGSDGASRRGVRDEGVPAGNALHHERGERHIHCGDGAGRAVAGESYRRPDRRA
jgi:hypothetical protein